MQNVNIDLISRIDEIFKRRNKDDLTTLIKELITTAQETGDLQYLVHLLTEIMVKDEKEGMLESILRGDDEFLDELIRGTNDWWIGYEKLSLKKTIELFTEKHHLHDIYFDYSFAEEELGELLETLL